MKTLVHFSFPYYHYHSLIQLNFIQELLDKGEEVLILHCNKGVSRCYGNPMGAKKGCDSCSMLQRQKLDFLKGNYQTLSLTNYVDSQPRIPINLEVENLNQLKSLVYRKVKIGLAAYSSYVSLTRNLYPKFDEEFRIFIHKILFTEIQMIDAFCRILDEHEIRKSVVTNARHFEVRPLFDLSLARGLELNTLEAGYSPDNKFNLGYNYGENNPNSIRYYTENITRTWQSTSVSKDQKVEIAKQFYERKRTGVKTGDKIYNSDTNSDEIVDPIGKIKISIFISSEDEFVGVGEEYFSKQVYSSQVEGVKHICQELEALSDYGVTVRVHPNLSGIEYSYHKSLYDLEKQFNNVKVIPAKSNASSYEIIDKSDLVVVFGSTIGIEAAYWGKPVVLLAGSFYYYLDVAYTPDSVEAALELLKNIPDPKFNENIFAFGYYFMIERGFQFNHFKKDERFARFGMHSKLNNENLFAFVARNRHTSRFNYIVNAEKQFLPTKETKIQSSISKL